MTYHPNQHHRRSIRLKAFDYAQAGAHFVTVVTDDRACLFGRVIDGSVRLSDGGLAAQACWLAIPAHYPFVQLDAFVVMPNHVHGVIVITSHGTCVGTDRDGPNVPMGADAAGPRDAGGARDRHGPNDPPGGHHSVGGTNDAAGANASVVGANDYSPLPRRSFRSPSKTVGSVVRGFKIGVTKWFRAHTDVQRVWQRNYHEHVIRDEASWRRIRDYIAANPARWTTDADYPRQSPS